MATITDINGTFDAAALSRLTWPIAWSGTTHADDRAEYETALAELVESAGEAMAEYDDAVSADIVAGVVVSVHSGDWRSE